MTCPPAPASRTSPASWPNCTPRASPATSSSSTSTPRTTRCPKSPSPSASSAATARPTTGNELGDHLFDHPCLLHVGQALVAAVVVERQAVKVEAEEVEQGGVEVRHADHVRDGA